MTQNRSILASCIVLVSVMTSACSYHGAIRPLPLNGQPTFSPAREPRFVVSDEYDGVREIEFTVYAVTFTYETKTGFSEAVSAMLGSVVEPLSAPSKMDSASPQSAVPYLQARTLSSTPTSATIEVDSRLDIVDVESGRVVRTYRSTRQANYSNPPSASALGFLTGLSLFTLSPVTIPIALQIEGNHGRDVLEVAVRESLDDIRKRLSQDIKRDDEARQVGDCFRRAAEDPALQSLVDDVALDSVENQTFDMLASEARPSDEEKVAIKEWASLISGCFVEQEAFMARWNAPSPVRALSGSTKTAAQNLRVLLYSGAITYGEYARRRQEIQDAFKTASAKIDAELEEQSKSASARAELLAIEAQKVNLDGIQARQAQAQTILMGIQTLNQSTAIAQHQLQHQQIMNQLNRPRTSTCAISRYYTSCSSW